MLLLHGRINTGVIRNRSLKAVNYFHKELILDVGLGSEYASAKSHSICVSFFGVSEPGASVVLWLKLFYRRIIIITSHYAIGYK